MHQPLYRIIYRSLFVSSLVLAGCAGADQVTTSAVGRPESAPAAQSRAGAQKEAPGLASENLRREQDRSSLDALRSGEAAKTPRNSAMKDVYFDFDRYNLDARKSKGTATIAVRANTIWH